MTATTTAGKTEIVQQLRDCLEVEEAGRIIETGETTVRIRFASMLLAASWIDGYADARRAEFVGEAKLTGAVIVEMEIGAYQYEG